MDNLIYAIHPLGEIMHAFPKNPVELKTYLIDPLYRNTFFIIITSLSSAGFGFIFWMLAARFYPQEDVGVATALISSMGMLILLSKLGLDQSIIRFFPTRDKSKVLGTAIIVTSLFGFVLGALFIATVDIWSPELHQVKDYAPLYITFLIANSVTAFIGAAFVALRKSEFYFLQSLLFGSRLLILIPLVFLGALGIFSSLGLSFIIALIVSIFLLYRSGIRLSGLDRDFLLDSFRFSAGNYFSGLLIAAPSTILPILVLNILGAEKAAQYFIAYALVMFLFLIPTSFTTSLFVEGSHGEALKRNVLKSLAGIFALLIPAVLGLFIFGEHILGLIGPDYVEGLELVKVLAISSFFFSFSEVFIAIKKVQYGLKSLIVISSIIFILLLGSSYILMLQFGILGVGYAWILTYALIGIFVVLSMAKRYVL